MFNCFYFASRRQKVIKMAFPLRRIFTRSITALLRPVENRFNASADARRSLRLCGPDWLQHFHHQADIDILYRKRPKHRAHIGLKCAFPLLMMSGVFPGTAVCLDEGFPTLIEGNRFGIVCSVARLLGLARREGIDPISELGAATAGFFPRSSQADTL